MKNNIFLIGFMGSGKTSVGKVLARKMKMNFIDADKEIEKVAGKLIKKIFADSGEAAFRQIEIDVIKLISRKKNSVVAVGGGAVLNYINVLRMRESGRTVLLRVSPECIARRLEGEKERPLLLGLNKRQKLAKIREMLKFREPFYNLAKDLDIETDDKVPGQIADKIMGLLGVSR